MKKRERKNKDARYPVPLPSAQLEADAYRTVAGRSDGTGAGGH